MIKDSVIEVIVKQPKKYIKLGYDVKVGDIIFINIIELPNGSHVLVNFICDYCNMQAQKEYRKLYNNPKHSCNKTECIRSRVKDTNLERYGVENPFQSKEFKQKIKETNLERYGVEHVSQRSDVKEKTKETNLGRYGVDNFFESSTFKDKSRETNIERYGVEQFTESTNFKEKSKLTNMEKYGVEYIIQNKDEDNMMFF